MSENRDKNDAPETVSAFTETSDVKVQTPAFGERTGQAGNDSDRMLSIPSEIAILPLRDMGT